MTADQSHSKLSRRAKSAVKCRNLMPRVGNRVEHFLGDPNIRVSSFFIYVYIVFFNLFVFHKFRGFSNLVFWVLEFRRSDILAFRVLVQALKVKQQICKRVSLLVFNNETRS